MSPEAAERTRAAETGQAQPDPRIPVDAVLTAGIRLAGAWRALAVALLALVAAEAQVLRASVAVVLLGGVALVALAVSLWACVVALIGWAFAIATGSIGASLGLLVALHLILVTVVWFTLRSAVHHASFPRTRAEVGALRRSLRRDLARFRAAAAPPDRENSAP